MYLMFQLSTIFEYYDGILTIKGYYGYIYIIYVCLHFLFSVSQSVGHPLITFFFLLFFEKIKTNQPNLMIKIFNPL